MTRGGVRVAALLAAVMAVGALLLVFADGEETWVTGTPASFAITWEVTVHVDPPEVTYDQLEIDRPYRSRLRTRAGAASGSELLAEQIETELGLFVRRDPPTGPVFRLAGSVPQPPTLDLRLVHSLPAALDQGMVIQGADDAHLGRACRWFLTRNPLAGGRWEPPTNGDETRTCLDRAGHVLVEERYFGGNLARTMAAVTLREGTPLTDDELFGGRPPAADPASILQSESLTGPLAERLAIEPPPTPPGFELDHVVSYRQVEPTSETTLVLGEYLAYRRGLDLLAVDSQRTVAQDAEVETAGVPVQTSLGEGRAIFEGRGTTVRVAAPGGALLTVTGTVSLDVLLAWMEAFVVT